MKAASFGRRVRRRGFNISNVSNSQNATCDALRSAFASAEYSPLFQFALRDRANPSGVLGPVLGPPCIRQRPFGMAGARQESPSRVLAPHLGAELGSPDGLPFFNQPLSRCMGFIVVIVTPRARNGLNGGVLAAGKAGGKSFQNGVGLWRVAGAGLCELLSAYRLRWN